MTDMSVFAETITKQKYAHKVNNESESWEQIAHRATIHPLNSVNADQKLINDVFKLILERKFIPGGRYLYASGRLFHQVQNCILLKAQDSRHGWGDLTRKANLALMTGAGIGVDYSDVRPEGSEIRKIGGKAAGPISLMQMINENGRFIQQGGSRRSAIWAGLNWKHQDIKKFIHIKDWSKELRELKSKQFNFPAPLDGTNISVLLDDDFFDAYHAVIHPLHSLAKEVYWETIKRMLKTGEPGFSIDVGSNSGETARNACTEITSFDSDDICNLGSINMARINSLEEMEYVVDRAVAYLLSGTVYGDVPYPEIDQIRNKNRRLGLGLMGIHEWLLVRGKQYGPDEELGEYLKIYASSNQYAEKYSKKWGLNFPIKTRAIAPTGTIGIIGETTTGIEPVFCVAYKRRYLVGHDWNYQFVIDPTAARLIEKYGVPPEKIEDAYTLANDVERRVRFQVWMQKYVDHGISSTINLPAWGTEGNNESKVEQFGKMLMEYLPKLRGITVYPDGSRGGQPLNKVNYSEAIKEVGKIFIEQADVCSLTKNGICGE